MLLIVGSSQLYWTQKSGFGSGLAKIKIRALDLENIEKAMWVFDCLSRPGQFYGILLKYFDSFFLRFSMGKTSAKFEFLHIVASTLKSWLT